MKKPPKKSDKNASDSFDPKKFTAENELTNKAIQNFLINKLNEKVEKKKDIEAMIHTIQEFLNSFIILGYNFEGEPISHIFAHNQQEADSLATLVNKTFMHNIQKDNS
ncbi:MAG: hypothetical protein EBU90_06735 [Proteobacteria bacterium]|nr:hypothetical protein [Pseudomonadota bacterium]NBP15004.1 hypothetical protein [bacterium]